jgi:hypothetical protein
VGPWRVAESRLGHLQALIYQGGADVNDIRAAVQRDCVAAARQQYYLLTPRARFKMTGDTQFTRR